MTGAHDTDISPLASVSPEARIGRGVRIGPFTVVHDNVVLEDDVVVESHCLLGRPTAPRQEAQLVIGRGGLIRSHSVFYEGSTFGPGLVTGHAVIVREAITAGEGLSIGSQGDFQGGRFGDHVRTQSNVLVAPLTEVGNFVWIFHHTVFTNDPTPPWAEWKGAVVEDYAVIAANCTILAGVRVGTRSLVGAQSMVRTDVPPDRAFAGVPAVDRGATADVVLRDGSGRAAYPWMRHFHGPYPDDVVARWATEFGTLDG